MVWKKTGVWGLRRRAAIRCVFLGDNPTRPQVEVLALVRGVLRQQRARPAFDHRLDEPVNSWIRLAPRQIKAGFTSVNLNILQGAVIIHNKNMSAWLGAVSYNKSARRDAKNSL